MAIGNSNSMTMLLLPGFSIKHPKIVIYSLFLTESDRCSEFALRRKSKVQYTPSAELTKHIGAYSFGRKQQTRPS
jgi:hypothetical protein